MSTLDPADEAAIDAVLEQLRATVIGAIDAAHKAYADILAVAGRSEPPPPKQFFAASVMQFGYCVVSGADATTFAGGDPERAWHAAKNAVDIANHYWSARFDLRRAETPTPNAPSQVPSA